PRQPSFIIDLLDLPLPQLLIDRQPIVDQIMRLVDRSNLAILIAGTGMGKTVLARVTANRIGGNWHLIDLHAIAAPAVADRLNLALGRLADLRSRGVVLDDFEFWQDSSVGKILSVFIAALRR